MAKKTRKKATPKGTGKRGRPERYERFCQEYSTDSNGARSVIAAGYSEAGASVTACQLLAKPNIRARIKQLVDERNARTLLNGDEILLGIKELAVSDIRRIFDSKTQCWLPMDEWPDDIARCVSSIESKELYNRAGDLVGYLKKVKLWEKPKSQENLGRNQGLFKDVVESKVVATVVSVDSKQVAELVDKIEKEF